MCRVNHHEKDACTARWFDPEDEPLNTLGEQTDLSLKNANFEDHMGLYKCQVCCGNRCRTLTSFVYPVRVQKGKEHIIISILIALVFLGWIRQVKRQIVFCYLP